MNFDRSLFIGKFSQEARELIQKLNERLILLEKAPNNPDGVRDLMRLVHTLKGSSKIMRFDTVSQLAHKMEDVLIGVQDERLTIAGDVIELLFTTTDLIHQCIEAGLSGQSQEPDTTTIGALLDAAARGEAVASRLAQLTHTVQLAGIPAQEENDDHNGEHRPVFPPSPEQPRPSGDGETIRIPVDRLDHAVRLIGEIAVNQRKTEYLLTTLKDLQRIARRHAQQMYQIILKGGLILPEGRQKELLHDSKQIVKSLDTVFKEHRDDMALQDMLINELYDDVLNMRMLPLDTVFETFPRAVRDLARQFQKEVDLQMTGGGTVLDKKIIEKLSSPLIHLLRNCIDHGIESPEERIAQGKPAVGQLCITAQSKSGHIELTVADDGRGVPLEKVRQRIVQRGLLSTEKAMALSAAELLNMIFLPGVSTSDITTDISGRGIGMDIVKTDIEQMKGAITVASETGRGTRYVLTLPVTLTSLRSLIVAVRQEKFAVPLDLIEETLLVSPAELTPVMGYAALRVQRQLIAVITLAEMLGLPNPPLPVQEHCFVLLSRMDGRRIGVIVDDILDEDDLVVKPLPAHMRKVKTIAGATIDRDNKVLLIVYLPEIINAAKQRLPQQESDSFIPYVVSPRILLVEDSANTGAIEQHILETHGYTVDLASDAAEALDCIKRTGYNLIITDIELPGMDGFALTEHLRHLPQTSDIPIIMVTSLEHAVDQQRGFAAGADAYITKGDFEQPRFMETVARLLPAGEQIVS